MFLIVVSAAVCCPHTCLSGGPHLICRHLFHVLTYLTHLSGQPRFPCAGGWIYSRFKRLCCSWGLARGNVHVSVRDQTT